MPRARPQKVFEIGPFDERTTWYGPVVSGRATRTTRIRVLRPAGGGRKAPVLFDGQVRAGRARLTPDPEHIVLEPDHRLYVTMFPASDGLLVELQLIEDLAASARSGEDVH